MEHNAEQIKKALECCVSLGGCQKCSYRERGSITCMYDLRSDALALINSQEQRIKELTEENERLMREKTALECVVSTERNQGKIDTVRKMQEKVEKKYFR